MGQRPPFAPGVLNTPLAPLDEMAFRGWVTNNKVPFPVNAPSSDYDMRGFYQALTNQNPLAQSAINANDGQMHYPDYWKNPMHQTFSAESRLAGPGAPTWSGSQLVSPTGEVVHDERFDPQALARALMMRKPGE